MGRYIRLVMRGAVAKSYEASQAATCIAAIDAGEYALRRVQGGSIIDGFVSHKYQQTIFPIYEPI